MPISVADLKSVQKMASGISDTTLRQAQDAFAAYEAHGVGAAIAALDLDVDASACIDSQVAAGWNAFEDEIRRLETQPIDVQTAAALYALAEELRRAEEDAIQSAAGVGLDLTQVMLDTTWSDIGFDGAIRAASAAWLASDHMSILQPGWDGITTAAQSALQDLIHETAVKNEPELNQALFDPVWDHVTAAAQSVIENLERPPGIDEVLRSLNDLLAETDHFSVLAPQPSWSEALLQAFPSDQAFTDSWWDMVWERREGVPVDTVETPVPDEQREGVSEQLNRLRLDIDEHPNGTLIEVYVYLMMLVWLLNLWSATFPQAGSLEARDDIAAAIRDILGLIPLLAISRAAGGER